jgi:thiol-disulfide isomerase/thioredoxin
MLRLRTLSIILALLAVVAIVVSPVLSQDADAQQLEARIKALENRIATLEKTLAQRLTAIERKVAQGGGAAGQAVDPKAEAAYAEVTQLMAAGDYEQAKTKMAAFMKTYGSSSTAKKARRTYQELSVIGKTAPETWKIEKWYQGESDVDLSSGKTTLLVFWEEWCPHCKREVPKMQALYNGLKAEGLQVVGLTKITRSSTEEKVTAFIADKQIAYPVAKETGEISSYFNVSGIPAAAVLKDGKVVWRGHPAQLNEAKLKAWM